MYATIVNEQEWNEYTEHLHYHSTEQEAALSPERVIEFYKHQSDGVMELLDNKIFHDPEAFLEDEDFLVDPWYGELRRMPR